MALSDKEQIAVRPSGRRRSVNAATNKQWSDSQKIEAVTLWLSLGNLVLVGATLKIPENTLRKWRATQWWKEIAEEIQLQDRIQLSATAKNIVDKSLETIADRLHNGDWIYDQKSGQMRRKPVAMKDALAVADKMLDHKERMDKTVVQTESTESVENKLANLMEKFARLAQPNVTDVIYVEAPSAENEEGAERDIRSGLLVRQGISETPGASEEPGGQECSEEDDEC